MVVIVAASYADYQRELFILYGDLANFTWVDLTERITQAIERQRQLLNPEEHQYCHPQAVETHPHGEKRQIQSTQTHPQIVSDCLGPLGDHM